MLKLNKDTKDLLPGIVGIILAISFIAFMMFAIFDMLDSLETKADEQRDRDVTYCQIIYDEPENFLPLDGTLEEKLERCETYYSKYKDQWVQAVDNQRPLMYFVLISMPIIFIGMLFYIRREYNDFNKGEEKK